MARTALLGIVLGLAGCGSDPPTIPPVPTPQPTAAPTPQPPQTPVWTGNQFHPPIVGVAHCCDNPTTPVDEGVRDGWAASTPEAMLRDQLASKGRINAIHIRYATVKDSHPTYKTPEELARACSFANSLGWLCEIDVQSMWSYRRSPHHADGNRYGLTCADTKKTGAPLQVKQDVEKIIALTQSMHAVYMTGTELWLCAGDQSRLRSWERSIIDSIKSVRPDAVIGSNATTWAPGISYYIIHGWPLDKTEPQDPGIAIVWNESDNQFHTTEGYLEAARLVYSRGGHVYFWRATLSDSDWSRLMAAIGDTF